MNSGFDVGAKGVDLSRVDFFNPVDGDQVCVKPVVTEAQAPAPALSAYSDASSGVPDFVKEMTGKTTGMDGPNCFGAAIGLFGSYVDTDEVKYYVDRDWVQISREQLKPGDMIVFKDYDHAAIYLGDDGTGPKVFHKPNWSSRSEYRIDRLDEAWWQVEKAGFWYTTNKWDRFGQPEPAKDACQNVPMKFYSRGQAAPVPSTYDVASALISTQLPIMQYYILRAADIIGLESFVRPHFSFVRSISSALTKFRNNFFPPAARDSLATLLPFGNELAEAYLRLSSLNVQIDALIDQWDPITERNARWKKTEVYRDGFISFDKALTGQIVLHLMALGVTADKLPAAVQETEKAIRSLYEFKVGLTQSGWSVDGIPFPIVDEIEKVAKKYVASAPEVPSFAEVVEVTPLDLLRDPVGVSGMLGGGDSSVALRLVPLPHDVLMRSAQELILKSEPAKLSELPRVERIVGAVEKVQVMVKKVEKF